MLIFLFLKMPIIGSSENARKIINPNRKEEDINLPIIIWFFFFWFWSGLFVVEKNLQKVLEILNFFLKLVLLMFCPWNIRVLQQKNESNKPVLASKKLGNLQEKKQNSQLIICGSKIWKDRIWVYYFAAIITLNIYDI